MLRSPVSVRLFAAVLLTAAMSACGGSAPTDAGTTPPPAKLTINPCSVPDTLRLNVAQTARVDCGNGGTTVTLAGNGASYLVVPEFATDQGANSLVPYSLATIDAALAALADVAPPALPGPRREVGTGTGTLPPLYPNYRQMAFDAGLRAEGARMAAAGDFQGAALVARSVAPLAAAAPATGSIRSFHVRSTFSTTNPAWKTVAARLRYAGSNVLLYVDTLAPANGFTDAQVQQFGAYFDGTLYPIDTAAFGQPSDVDQNGHIIMLMSPVVNGDTPKADCKTNGYVLGFFDPTDFDPPSDPNSNQGEVFYSIVPDPDSTVSCAHTVSDVSFSAPATFLHELQHLISFSQHVIVHGGQEQDGWLDEGMSIVAEELGSRYYEDRCPPPACRTNASQLFPDSAQGFISGFLYDSYQYALRPDTASVTLHTDADNGFSWRGGDWALLRWLGDHYGNAVFKAIEDNATTGVPDIEAATGQPFPSLFADFGLSLYTDSLPGLPRATAPAADRFVSRNLSQLWARLYVTSGPSSDYPLLMPLQLNAITNDTTSKRMMPGTPAYYRLDTPQNAATVTLLFSAPGAHALSTALNPQLAIFRLPPGQ